ncbi:tRNA (adenine(22)-N(1))-methyltransferase TrmK [Peribacillus psychrosaccharolyticus]|uniref:tRNA (Adenine(22)-N(1))-methyltransferase TrmK n=1 Tax=Peribacillus psychrosaccharolyticus TaxID=1407 RepID=A0A974NLC5_PERPY|nr:tRNA (adenine(22)-N(1))-methyltransferase TrmK [Peribacillus psychrosaccharolyticus]MEC2054312.1 tRNA (adenine(22)-N(1))-methyltransferase TrmK [Peribacillus psychrosaccharolyticus]MED3744460.1 tRNA (adenine(22)-N(1))-methyltransferase TrmK [Peribacillus psychrosaccharolyticus]QQS99928.1 tRNA (adenine(22)-N(1))-methyltransferase TrmK [Peribacillus psychrosaccharolyticus]
MNHEKLSERLERVSIHIPKDSILADIGSDHAYLPCYAIEQGLAARAIAGEVSEGPFQSACSQVKQTELDEVIEVRKGDGLDVLQEGEATCITICGMGGALISQILDRGKTKLSKVERLILQPNIAANIVRNWLKENGWELVGEDIVEEDGKIYEILIAEQGEPLRPYGDQIENGLLFGPFLLAEQSDVFKKKWNFEKSHWERILRQMPEKGENQETEAKREQLIQLIKQVKEIL